MKNQQVVKVAEESISAFLKARDHMRNDLTPRKQSYVQMFKKYYATTDTFILAKPFENFEVVQENQLIGIDGQEEIRAPKQSLILFAHNGTKVGDEVFLLGVKEKGLTQ